MSDKPTAQRWLSLPVISALTVTAVAVLVPHVTHLPPWVTAAFVLLCLWRYWGARRGQPPPPRWLRIVLTLAATVGIILTFGTITGRDAGVSLLTLMTALKLLELRDRRDTFVAIYLCYFLAATEFLFDQSLPLLAYLLAVVWLATAVLIGLARQTPVRRPWEHARTAAVLLLQALPVMLVLFLLVPRVAGPLWGLPENAHAGVTGLSDTMSPGSISRLSRSDAVAFRVDFEGTPPPPARRYWRGPVLSRYDGRTWHRAERDAPPPDIAFGDSGLSYTVYLEPSNQYWLPALEMPAAAPEGATLTGAYEVKSPHRVYETMRYRLTMHSDYRLQPRLSAEARRRLTRLPAHRHPHARALARRWRRRYDRPRAVAAAALRYFHDRPFVYTLRPPTLGRDTVDQFLFDTRRGFCEHFASAFTVLMRAAGIPARVVTGYQGGKENPNGDYMIVRQSDAHAWSEIWLRGRGWVRYDPTAAVAPSRVEAGLGASVPADDPVPAMARPGNGLLKRLRLQWDTVNALWNRWVLGYGPDLQSRLMGRIGLASWQRAALALVTAITALLAVLAFLTLGRHSRRPADPVLEQYRRLGRKLARAGFPPRPGEGPRDYCRRVAASRPEWRAQLEAIIGLYTALRYGGSPGAGHGPRELRRRVSRFRPR